MKVQLLIFYNIVYIFANKERFWIILATEYHTTQQGIKCQAIVAYFGVLYDQIMNIPDFQEKDRKYEIGLLILGGIIGYVSTLYGGVVILLIIGAILALIIGITSDSLKKAILLGAFFGIIVITSSSQYIQGYNSDWNNDVMTTIFLPYIREVLVAGISAGTVAAFGHSLQFRRR